MKTQLDAMAEFLSGQESEAASRIRSELANRQSETARFLTAAQRLSRDALAPYVFKRLGLPLVPGGSVPDVPRGRQSSSSLRRCLRVLPWLTTALAMGAILWLILTCPCIREKLNGPNTRPAVAVSPIADDRQDPLPPNPPPSGKDLPDHETKKHPDRSSDPDKEELKQRVADFKSRLETEETEITRLRGQLVEQVNNLRTAEAENERVRREMASLRQDARAMRIEKEKQREEEVQLRAQMEKILQDRTATIEDAVINRTAQLRKALEEARRELQSEHSLSQRLQKQVDEVAKSSQSPANAIDRLQKEIDDLSGKLRESERDNERLRKEVSDQKPKTNSRHPEDWRHPPPSTKR
jgi:hypothetical protein